MRPAAGTGTTTTTAITMATRGTAIITTGPAATIQARLQGGRISLEAANEAIEQLRAPLAILGWEHEASDEPNVTPEEFWATVEAFAPKASGQQADAG